MAVERIDYYSDEEYQYALMQQEAEYNEQWKRQKHEEQNVEVLEGK